MFTARRVVPMQVSRAESLRLGLEKACDDYISGWWPKSHGEIARLIKFEINHLATTHAKESLAFKVAWIQFLTAVLMDYLKKESSKRFWSLVSEFCDKNLQELHGECLKSVMIIYPAQNLLEYLITQNPASLWVTQGGIAEFKERYDFYLNHSPQSVSISYDIMRPVNL